MICGAGVVSAQPEPSLVPTRHGVPASWRSTTSSDPGQGRFVAGHVLGGRYRITGLLGRGGMGEVYRADDLKLGQPVALKFLPANLSSDPGRLARFHGEVRLARQVSHPNVCRVYDIGEADGQPFLTMEYVDGEDLASLLRRIRRLPADKGVEVARQICAGLAAAHDRGVIHRDLKPANIMIDGRGKARITDFGLAEAADAGGRDLHAGTPLYMAPEQLEGREATVRSDVYALGLVLYELFTGQMPFPSDSRAAWERARRESTPLTPSSVTPGLDPAVERVVLRCLQSDPAQRPASALAVSAALPGGDPLAAALAAGETPSPEMVAAAGAEGAVSPRVAWACLVSILGLIALAVAGSSRTYLVNVAGLELSAPVLAQKAREALTSLGHQAPAEQEAYGFQPVNPWLDWLERNDPSPDRWKSLAGGRPPGITFWFRQSPRLMVSKDTFARISPEEPPLIVPGMAAMLLDPQGRVVEYQAVPGEAAPAEGSPPVRQPVPMTRLFDLAGIDAASFKPAVPERTPPVFCDERAAWEGTIPERPGLPLRIEACSLNGRPVHFAIHGLEKPGEDPSQKSAGARTADQIGTLLIIVALVGALFMARHNVAAGRGDRRGAFTVAVYFTVMHVLVWAMWVSHVPLLSQEWSIFSYDTGWTLFNAVSIWLFYLALEPWVRRLWPDTIISWSRLLAGRLRDPRVGRDLLVGLLMGAISGNGRLIESWAVSLLGWPPARPAWFDAGDLMSLYGVAAILDGHVHAILYGMQMLSILLLLRILVRKVWLAAVLLAVPLAGQLSLGGATYPWISVPITVVFALVIVTVMVRFGLLAGIAGIFVSIVFDSVQVTSHLGAWHSGPTWLMLAALTGLALFAFHTSLGGRPALRLLPEDQPA
ncbi:MAG: serine/threonine-protein kinase [Candidatus Polarisedimenticolia bacterium]